MSSTYSDSVLTQDELAFIREMDFVQQSVPDAVDLKLDLDGDGRINLLLERLGLASELKLVAQYHNQQLVFPVAIAQGEFGKFSMELRSPEIFELGEHLRNWRCQLSEPLFGFCSISHKEFALSELSSTGLCIQHSYHNAPKQLKLALGLPESKDILELRAQKVRQVSDSKTAYRIELDDLKREALRRSLFKLHRHQNQNLQLDEQLEAAEALMA